MISELSLCLNCSITLVGERIMHGYHTTISQMSEALHYEIVWKKIHLDHCQVNQDVCSALIYALSSCTSTLEVIDLRGMSIQLNDMLQVTAILTQCEKLRVFDIGCFVISQLQIAKNLCSIIKKNHATIACLCLCNCNFGIPESEEIKETLTVLTAVETMTLENCKITHEMASCLASVCKYVRTCY